jgi:hypothetical protein
MRGRSTGFFVLAALFALALMVVGAPAGLAHHTDDGDHQASDHDGDADQDPNHVEDESASAEATADAGDNAHPSGKDRSIENSGEHNWNQGKAESHPDDTNGPLRSEGTAGMPDKTNDTGGTDLADQDGNNGCGNDDDFNDDNNGWCGKPADVTVTVPEEEVVQPDVIERPETGAEVPEVPAVVLGAQIHKEQPQVAAAAQARAAALPFTGAYLAAFVLAALAMITSGGLILRMNRS